MRKSLFTAATLCLLASLSLQVRAQEDVESSKVQGLEVKLMEAYKQRQIQTFASLLDDNLVITFEDGNTYGKTGYTSYAASTSIRVDVVEMSDLKIRMHGDTAVLTGSYHERGESKSQPYEYRDRFTDVWKKKDGKWKLIASHYGVPFKQ